MFNEWQARLTNGRTNVHLDPQAEVETVVWPASVQPLRSLYFGNETDPVLTAQRVVELMLCVDRSPLVSLTVDRDRRRTILPNDMFLLQNQTLAASIASTIASQKEVMRAILTDPALISDPTDLLVATARGIVSDPYVSAPELVAVLAAVFVVVHRYLAPED